jgi:hypothetical protein
MQISNGAKINIFFIVVALSLFGGAWHGERGGIKLGYTKAFNEPEIKKREFLRCFYDLIRLNLPYYAEEKGEWDLCDPLQPREPGCNPDISFLNSHNVMYIEGVCAGKTGGEMMNDESKY